MKIKIFKIFRKKKSMDKMILNQKINSIQNDLTIMKIQINTILALLKRMEGK